MQTDAYTSEAICASLGLPSFEKDPACTRAMEALHLLLKPSFHPEICLTFADGNVSVVSARAMIWHQFEPAPVLTDRAEGIVPAEDFARLLAPAEPVVRSGAVRGIMIDGMPSELLIFRDGAVALRTEGNAGKNGDYSALVGFAISTAWDCISNPFCRNALADAAEYVGKKLPHEVAPARKPTIGTMVLGSEEDRAELLEALRVSRGS